MGDTSVPRNKGPPRAPPHRATPRAPAPDYPRPDGVHGPPVTTPTSWPCRHSQTPRYAVSESNVLCSKIRFPCSPMELTCKQTAGISNDRQALPRKLKAVYDTPSSPVGTCTVWLELTLAFALIGIIRIISKDKS